jgi:hypothetical protein
MVPQAKAELAIIFCTECTVIRNMLWVFGQSTVTYHELEWNGMKWNSHSKSLIYNIIYNADEALHTSPYETKTC